MNHARSSSIYESGLSAILLVDRDAPEPGAAERPNDQQQAGVDSKSDYSSPR